MFEDFTPDAPTVGSTFRQCSMNRTLLDQGNSLVTQTVYTKCSGSRCVCVRVCVWCGGWGGEVWGACRHEGALMSR